MNFVQKIPDRAPLAGAVEIIFVVEGYLPGHQRERLVPNGRMNLVIELDGRTRHIYDNETGKSVQDCLGSWLSGVHSKYITIGDTNAESRLIAVQFAPGASVPFTHRDAGEFCDLVVPAASVFGATVDKLRQELLAAGNPDRQIDLLMAWLADRFEASLAAPDYLADALARVLADPGEVRLTELAEQETPVSYKHFIEVFRRQVGPSPKNMQRILRFAQVFAMIQAEEKVNWAALSAELGYSDQAHFIREFRRFSGYRPAEFRDQGHDRLNFFPDDPETKGG